MCGCRWTLWLVLIHACCLCGLWGASSWCSKARCVTLAMLQPCWFCISPSECSNKHQLVMAVCDILGNDMFSSLPCFKKGLMTLTPCNTPQNGSITLTLCNTPQDGSTISLVYTNMVSTINKVQGMQKVLYLTCHPIRLKQWTRVYLINVQLHETEWVCSANGNHCPIKCMWLFLGNRLP